MTDSSLAKLAALAGGFALLLWLRRGKQAKNKPPSPHAVPTNELPPKKAGGIPGRPDLCLAREEAIFHRIPLTGLISPPGSGLESGGSALISLRVHEKAKNSEEDDILAAKIIVQNAEGRETLEGTTLLSPSHLFRSALAEPAHEGVTIHSEAGGKLLEKLNGAPCLGPLCFMDDTRDCMSLNVDSSSHNILFHYTAPDVTIIACTDNPYLLVSKLINSDAVEIRPFIISLKPDVFFKSTVSFSEEDGMWMYNEEPIRWNSLQ